MRPDTETVRHNYTDRAVTPATAQMPSHRMWQKIGNGLMLALLVLAPGIAIALNLATTPLFLTTNGKGNIVFIGDDSTSMDWALVTSETDGVMTVGNCTYHYVQPGAGASADAPARNITGYDGTDSPHGSMVPSEESLSGLGFWRAWNKDYNKLYYDPSVTYTPWSGADLGGTTFAAANASAAYYNPYRTSQGSLPLTTRTSYKAKYHATNCNSGNMNVTDFYPARYYTWDSGTSDGVVDASDSHTLVEITSGRTYPITGTKPSTRTDCANSTYCTYAEEIQNFANWFSYYRKRDLTMKAAISSVVEDSLDRVAYTVLNDTSDTAINISILTMNDSATSGNKRTLLNGLYSTVPDGSTTPLRERLDAVGRYFECVAGNAFGLAAGSANCPIQTAAEGGACQQNFAVLVTDGGWTDSFHTSVYAVGNTDEDGSGSYDGSTYADTVSNTLADIAMHYYERDLSTLSDQVPTLTGVDTASHQHMVTYALALGISGNLTTSPPVSPAAWPTALAVTSSDADKIDDLRHAAYNGRGSFLSAYTPDALVTALTTAMSGVTGRTASAAAVAVNSRSLSTSTRLYQARFNSEKWSGDLRALSIDTDGTVNLTTPVWSAEEQLESQDWDSGRTIITRNASRGIPFRWTTAGDNALTTTQMTALKTNSGGTTDADSVGEARLKWLRGDTSNEGTGASNFRVRTGGFKLGDIVNSTPVFVGAPPALPNLETTAHSTFRTAVVNRPERIYVGANDGMLHGFDASTGQEKLAYLPTAVFDNITNDNLSRLTFNTGYTHRFYVDGTPTAGDAYAIFTNVSSICSTGCWRTVLVGGMGAGGKGLYALDVTDPDGTKVNTNLAFSNETNNAAEISLWEFTASGDEANDVGYIFGQPTIVKLHNDKWGVVTGNGYNSADGKAILYILDIKDGSVIKKIDLGGTANGLSTPAVVDTNSDYIADYVFAGDLNGKLWKIDITSSNTNSWGSTYTESGSAVPLFAAVAANSSSQVITERPEIGSHTTGTGYMVYFGTGRYLGSDDKNPSSAPVNTFYGIWDKSYTGSGTPVTRSKLLTQTISTATVSSTTVRVVTNNTIGWCTSNNPSSCSNCETNGTNCLGWKDDLLTSASDSLGEMSVSNPVLLGGALPRIIFTTLIPQSDACSYGGSSWLMELNPTNGGRLSEAVFDIDSDGVITNADKATVDGESVMVSGINPGIGIMPEPVILRDPANKRDLKTEPGSTGDIQTIKNYVSGTTGGRQSWRQLR